MNTYRFINADEYTKMIEDIIDRIENDQVKKYIDLYKKYFVHNLVDGNESPYFSPTNLDNWIKYIIEDELILVTVDDPEYDKVKHCYDNTLNGLCCIYKGESHLIVYGYNNCFLLSVY